ncbi:MAG: ABC transporter permease, partial [Mycobacterium sp.]
LIVVAGWLATPWEHAVRSTGRRSVVAPVVGGAR